MISKFTKSIKTYAFVIAYGHLLLFITLFPVTSLLLFCIFVPMAYITLIYCLIDYIHRQSGFSDQTMILYDNGLDNTFLAPNMAIFVADSPLDIDYDIGIH